MDEAGKMSAAAFVEGGIQDACDDACSICLEDFCESDPSTVTGCKHEFHLQCVLDWCQRSSHCPMCWQLISLKDPASQELLEAVEHERDIRSNLARTTTIIHHPALGDFELQQLPVGINEAEIEERIMQHLAAAAAMGRPHHIGRREGQRGRSAGHGRPQFLVFSTNSGSSVSAPSPQRGQNEPGAGVASSPSSTHSTSVNESANQVPGIIQAQADQVSVLSSQPCTSNANRPGVSTGRSSAGQSTSAGHDRGGPSDFQSFSESLKARLTSVSMKYKESITKSTRGWKERLFSRNNSVADVGSQGRRDANAEIASISRMMEHLDTGEGTTTSGASSTQSARDYSAAQPANETALENNTSSLPNDSSTSISLAANTSSS